MQLIDRLKQLSGAVQAAMAFLALFPSLATLIGIVPVPEHLASLVAFIFAFFGLGIVCLAAILSKEILQLKSRTLALIVVACLLGGGLGATGHALFAGRHSVTVSIDGKNLQFLTPIEPGVRLQRALDAYNGDYIEMIYTSNQREQILGLIHEESLSSEIVVVLLLLFSQVLLVSGVTIAFWRATDLS